MTEQQGNKILGIVGKFCDDNDNNKINSWSCTTFINTVKQELFEILKEDSKSSLENKKVLDDNLALENKKRLEALSDTGDAE